jgi:hypothetical protein
LWSTWRTLNGRHVSSEDTRWDSSGGRDASNLFIDHGCPADVNGWTVLDSCIASSHALRTETEFSTVATKLGVNVDAPFVPEMTVRSDYRPTLGRRRIYFARPRGYAYA